MPRPRAHSEPNSINSFSIEFSERAAYEAFTPHTQSRLPLPTTATLADMAHPWVRPAPPSRLVNGLLLSLYLPADADNPSCPLGYARDFFHAHGNAGLEAKLANSTLQRLNELRRQIQTKLTAQMVTLLPTEIRQKILGELLDDANAEEIERLTEWMIPHSAHLAEFAGGETAYVEFGDATIAADMQAVVQLRLDQIAREYVTEHETFMRREVLAAERQQGLGLGLPGYDDELSWQLAAYSPEWAGGVRWQWDELRLGFRHRLEARVGDMMALKDVLDAIDTKLARLVTARLAPVQAAGACRAGKRKEREDDAAETGEPARKQQKPNGQAGIVTRLSELTLERVPSSAPKHIAGPSRPSKRKHREDDASEAGQPAWKEQRLNEHVSVVFSLNRLILEQRFGYPVDSDSDEESDGDWEGESLSSDGILESDDNLAEEYDGLEDFEREHEEANEALREQLSDAMSEDE